MQLGEDERGPLVGVEFGEQRVDDRVSATSAATTPSATAAPRRPGGGPARSRRTASAHARRAIARIQVRALDSPRNAGQGTDDADERVLRQVVGLVAAHEVRAQPPHVGLSARARRPRTRADRRASPRAGWRSGRPSGPGRYSAAAGCGHRGRRAQQGTPRPARATIATCMNLAELPARPRNRLPPGAHAVLGRTGRRVRGRRPAASRSPPRNLRGVPHLRRRGRSAASRRAHRAGRRGARPHRRDPPRHRGTDRRAPAGGWSRPLRLALFTIALVEILVALPALLGGSEHVQHLAAFDVALAVGFLWVAAQPARALSGFLPIGTALVVSVCGSRARRRGPRIRRVGAGRHAFDRGVGHDRGMAARSADAPARDRCAVSHREAASRGGRARRCARARHRDAGLRARRAREQRPGIGCGIPGRSAARRGHAALHRGRPGRRRRHPRPREQRRAGAGRRRGATRRRRARPSWRRCRTSPTARTSSTGGSCRPTPIRSTARSRSTSEKRPATPTR